MQGGLSDNQNKRVLQVKKGGYLPKPGDADLFSEPARDGYTLGGFSLGTEADGQVSYTREWDFDKDVVLEDMTLYAVWYKNYTLKIHYGEGFAEVSEKQVRQPLDGSNPTVASASILGYTVIAYYSDSECKNEISFPYELVDDDGDMCVDIYADALKGNWQLVRTGEELSKTNIQMGTNVMLLDNIDMSGYNLTVPSSYTGTFDGNGHTISNLTVTDKQKNWSDNYFGIFKQLLGKATVKDLTFDNLTLNITLDNPDTKDFFVGGLAGSASSDVTLSNIKLNGVLNVASSVAEEKIDIDQFVGSIATENVSGCDASGMTVQMTAVA